MDTGSFIVYMKTEDIYSVIAKYVKTRFNTSNYELDRPLLKEKQKSYWISEKWITWKSKDVEEFKMYSYLKDDRNFWELSGLKETAS